MIGYIQAKMKKKEEKRNNGAVFEEEWKANAQNSTLNRPPQWERGFYKRR
jgi:hypothetical protein